MQQNTNEFNLLEINVENRIKEYIDSIFIHYDEILEYVDVRNKFIQKLKDVNAYIAGGSINSAIHNSEINDLDIYIYKENFLTLYNFFKEIPFQDVYEHNFGMITNLCSSYENTFFKKNGLLFRVNIYFIINKIHNKTKKNLDILVLDNSRSIKDVIMNFDLSFCSTFLEYDNDKIKLGGNYNQVINKEGKLNLEYGEKYLFNKLIKRRINKYLSKGYKIEFNADIKEISITKKEITNKIVIYSIINQIVNNYYINILLKELNSNKFEAISYLGSRDYEINEFEQNVKNYCTFLFNDSGYYILLIQQILDLHIFITDYDYLTKSEYFMLLFNLFNDYKFKINDLFNKLDDKYKKFPSIEQVLTSSNNYITNVNNIYNYINNLIYSNSDYNIFSKIKNNIDTKYKWIFNTEILLALKNNNLIPINEELNITKYYIDKNEFNNLNVFIIDENKDIQFNIFKKQSNFNDYILFIKSFNNSQDETIYKCFAVKFSNLINENKFFVECSDLTNKLSVITKNTYFNHWFYKLSFDQILGISYKNFYKQILNYYISNKVNNIFYLHNLVRLKNISSVEAIITTQDQFGQKNIFGDYVFLLSEKHCQGRTFENLTFKLVSDKNIYYDMEKEKLLDEFNNTIDYYDFIYEDTNNNKWYFDTDKDKMFRKIDIGDIIYNNNMELLIYGSNSKGEIWKHDKIFDLIYYEDTAGIKEYDNNKKINYLSNKNGITWKKFKDLDFVYTIIESIDQLEILKTLNIISYKEDFGYIFYDELLFHLLTYDEKTIDNEELITFRKERTFDQNIYNLKFKYKNSNTLYLNKAITFDNIFPPSLDDATSEIISYAILPKIIDNTQDVYYSISEVVYNKDEQYINDIMLNRKVSVEIPNYSAWSPDPWKYYDIESLRDHPYYNNILPTLPEYRMKELNPPQIEDDSKLILKYDLLIKQIPKNFYNEFNLNNDIIKIIRQLPLNISLLNNLKNIKQDSDHSKIFVKTINDILDLRETLENQINLVIDEYNEDYTEQNKCYNEKLSDYIAENTKFNNDFFDLMLEYNIEDNIPECVDEYQDINLKIIKLKLIDYILLKYDTNIIEYIQSKTDKFNNIIKDLLVIKIPFNNLFVTDYMYDLINENKNNVNILSLFTSDIMDQQSSDNAIPSYALASSAEANSDSESAVTESEYEQEEYYPETSELGERSIVRRRLLDDFNSI